GGRCHFSLHRQILFDRPLHRPQTLAIKPSEPIPGTHSLSLEIKSPEPREWVQVLFVDKYFVRDDKWKLHENGQLNDVRDAPYAEPSVLPEADTAESKAARERLQAIMTQLHPVPSASGRTGEKKPR
ncbi:MAG: hypothetical protein NTW21_12070, partial [Verrucomicrobia bacterium]|nr:hypothetical protein [Verrucomicrobiota bacterium]